MKRVYVDVRKRCWPWRDCEHCDGENSPHVRVDYLRGYVCKVCDDALDQMLAEEEAEGVAK